MLTVLKREMEVDLLRRRGLDLSFREGQAGTAGQAIFDDLDRGTGLGAALRSALV